MRTLVLGLGLVLSTSAFAAAPKGNGDFRRADVIKAAHAGKTARVVGISTAANHVETGKLLKTSRLEMVDNKGKVSFEKAPLAKGQRVTTLSASSVNRLGLKTQAQAETMAEKNAGEMGATRAVKLKDDGLDATGGSFKFDQVSPKTVRAKTGLEKGSRMENITRTVTVSGTGESASGAPIIK